MFRQAVRLFGQASFATRVQGFDCPQTFGLSFQWTGETALGDPIPLPAALSAARTLYLPPKTLPTDVVSRFLLRVCYVDNPDPVLCDVATRDFMVRSIVYLPR